ncbi:hypothetical protein THRCLA_03391 [Thraustotheca clavata]|uniref:WW domain-containing protein n=1 Tax=Thraustotheca clavata TaxID=74557 RepID=A0A1W0A245_9STRA|nr:hypothetical protein THRCLA_03391 [Thraustotheca clavata]
MTEVQKILLDRLVKTLPITLRIRQLNTNYEWILKGIENDTIPLSIYVDLPNELCIGKYTIEPSWNGIEYQQEIEKTLSLWSSWAQHNTFTIYTQAQLLAISSPICYYAAETSLKLSIANWECKSAIVRFSQLHQTNQSHDYTVFVNVGNEYVNVVTPKFTEAGYYNLAVSTNDGVHYTTFESPHLFVYHKPSCEFVSPEYGISRGNTELNLRIVFTHPRADEDHLLVALEDTDFEDHGLIRVRFILNDACLATVNGSISNCRKYIQCRTPKNTAVESFQFSQTEAIALELSLDGELFFPMTPKKPFMYYAPPQLKSYYVTSGPVTGGTYLSIELWNLLPCTLFTRVRFRCPKTFLVKDAPATKQHQSLYSLQCTTPPWIISEDADKDYALVIVEITLNGVDFHTETKRFQLSTNEYFQGYGSSFLYYREPKIYFVTPAYVSTLGGVDVVLHGDALHNYGDRIQVAFSSGKTTRYIDGRVVGASIVCTSPSFIPGLCNVLVSLNAQQFSGHWNGHGDCISNDVDSQVRMFEPPVFTTLVPSSSPLSGGGTMQIYGKNFIETGSIEVRFAAPDIDFEVKVPGRVIEVKRLESIEHGDAFDQSEICRILRALCIPIQKLYADNPYPSVADSIENLENGGSVWHAWTIYLVNLLKQTSKRIVPKQIKTATLLLLFYLSCNTNFAPMLILEGLVPALVEEILYIQHPLVLQASPVVSLSPLCHELNPLIAVDAMRYCVESLVIELTNLRQLDYLIPLGPASMLYILESISLPQTEVDECLIIEPQQPVAPCTESPRNVHDKLARIVAQSTLYQYHLAVRILVVLTMKVLSKANSIERRRLLDDGVIQALSLASTLPQDFGESNTKQEIPNTNDNLNSNAINYERSIDRIANDNIYSFVTQSPRDFGICTVLSIKHAASMARSGLSYFSQEELHKIHREQSLLRSLASKMINSTKEETKFKRLLKDPTYQLFTRSELIIQQLQKPPTPLPSPIHDKIALKSKSPGKQSIAPLQVRLDAVKAPIPMPKVCICPRCEENYVIIMVKHAEDVSQSLVQSFLLLRKGLDASEDFRAWIANQPTKAQREDKIRIEKEHQLALEAAKKQAFELEMAIKAACERENALMILHDKPKESEQERRIRLEEKRRELAAWRAQRELNNALQVEKILHEKQEALERVEMAKHDVSLWIVKKKEAINPAEVEEARINLLRQQIREAKSIQMEEKSMRAEDNRARLHRKYLWEQCELQKALEAKNIARELRCMHVEETQCRQTWHEHDEKAKDDQLNEKLDQRKRLKADERKKRRQQLHPELYSNWKRVYVDKTTFYYENSVTGQTQWETPVLQDPPSGWELIPDASSGKFYYYNSSTGESSWEMPSYTENTVEMDENPWTECLSEDGATYYYNTTTGQSVWSISEQDKS